MTLQEKVCSLIMANDREEMKAAIDKLTDKQKDIVILSFTQLMKANMEAMSIKNAFFTEMSEWDKPGNSNKAEKGL